jgi:phenylacetate-CoA ligase
LEDRFGCPVLDVYSLNEAGPVAVFDPVAGGHVLLQPGMYVEILGDDDEPAPPGSQGEITLTGGFNFCLPLLRYRTGDHAAWGAGAGELRLSDLLGRPPIRFRTAGGEWINNIDVTHALGRFPLAQYALHQGRDGALALRAQGFLADEPELRRAILDLFGAGQPLSVERVTAFEGKVVQYTSDLGGAAP